MRYLLIVIGLSGCGGGLDTHTYQYRGLTFTSDVPLRIEYIQANVDKAVDILDTAHVVPRSAFGHIFRDSVIVIHDVEYLEILNQEVSGYWDAFTNDILLNRYGQALLHELLHNFEGRYNPFTSLHLGWDKGWDALDEEFAYHAYGRPMLDVDYNKPGWSRKVSQ